MNNFGTTNISGTVNITGDVNFTGEAKFAGAQIVEASAIAFSVARDGNTPSTLNVDTMDGIVNVRGTLTATIDTASQPNITTMDGLTSINGQSFEGNDIKKIVAITDGTASIGKALVTDENNNITGINSLSATSLTGTLQTVSQPNVTTMAGLNSINGQSVSGTDLAKIVGITNGTSASGKALVMDGSNNISNINSLSATSLTGTLQTVSQPNVTTMAGLNSINGQSVSGTDLAKIVGVTNGTPASGKALVVDSNLDLIGGSGIRDITSSGTINANSILLTNQLGSASSPNINCFMMSTSGLYYNKNSQLVGLSVGGTRIIEGDSKNNKAVVGLNTDFLGDVKLTTGALRLPSSGALGVKTLDFYETYPGTLNWSGAFTQNYAYYYATRIGNLVTISFEQIYASSGAVVSNKLTSTTLPARFCPQNTHFGIVLGSNNSSASQITYAIVPDGEIQLGAGLGLNNFTAEANTIGCGAFSFSVSYSIAP